MKKVEKKLLGQIPLKLLLVTGFFILALFTLSFIIHKAVYQKEDTFDNKSIAFFSAHSSPALVHIMEDVSFFGSTTFLLPMYVLIVGLQLKRKKPQLAIDIAIIAIVGTAMLFALKEFFHRHRPLLPVISDIGGYSFPSGHSFSSFIFCSILMYLVWRGNFTIVQKYFLVLLLIACIAAIGISRLVLNVHYATDVIGGFCLGFIWVTFSFWLLRRFRKDNSHNKVQQPV
jgi:undecaprenyl-diphosphatase